MYVELFGRPKYEILADLITKDNNLTTALNASYLSFGNITGSTVPGTEDRVSVLVTGRSPITGSKTFTYTRIELNKLLSSVGPSLVLPETATTVADLLPLRRKPERGQILFDHFAERGLISRFAVAGHVADKTL